MANGAPCSWFSMLLTQSLQQFLLRLLLRFFSPLLFSLSGLQEILQGPPSEAVHPCLCGATQVPDQIVSPSWVLLHC